MAGVEVVEQYEDYFGLVRGTLGAQRERARAERLEAPRDATLEENLGDIVCPYMGLRAFELGDAELFFGREAQVEDVLAELAESRFVAVIGASGSGKSSFVRAGLLARLSTTTATDSTSPHVALLAPGKDPLGELANALSAATSDRVPVVPDSLRADPDRLQLAARRAGERGLVIVVDQFEELFTQCEDETQRCCFIDALIAAWRDPTSRVVVILALRADFYGRVAAYPGLAAAVVAHQTLIGPLGPAELRRAIELPASQTGLLLQPGLTDTLLEDLAGVPGALPLLSHALLETWKRRRRLMLTVGGYRETGGVRGAIAQTAEHTLNALPEGDQAIARSIFLSLTDVADSAEPTSRRVDRANLAASIEATQRHRVLDVLAAARLVTLDERTVTVAHEALIRHWPRLRGWIEADRAGLLTHRRLTTAAGEWDKLDREPGALYRGARLATAREWADEHADDLTGLERDFLTASQTLEHAELEAAKRRTRRLRILATTLAGSTVAVALLAVWALGLQSNAQRQRNHAIREATDATSLALSSSATSVLNSRPDISLLLAFEAYRARPRAEARSSVFDALITPRTSGLRAVLHSETPVVSVAFHRDRNILAYATDQTIRLWDTNRHTLLGKPLIAKGSGGELAFTPDGRALASVGTDGTARLWDTHSHKQLGKPLTVFKRPPSSRAFVFSVAFSPDGGILASTAGRRTIRLWDTRTHKPVGRPLTVHEGPAFNIALSLDGRTVAYVSADFQTIRLWDTVKHQQLGVLRNRHIGSVSSMGFSPNGRTLAIAGDDGTIRLFNSRKRQQLGKPLTAHKGTISSVAFSRNGRTLASTGDDGAIRLFNTRNHQQLGKALAVPRSTIFNLAFSPDGRTLAAGGRDGTTRLWDTNRHAWRDKRLTGHKAPISSMAFSTHRNILASASYDGTIRLWDTVKHQQLGKPFTGPTGPASSIAFSPDDRTLAAADRHGTIRLWDTERHRQIGRPLTGHKSSVLSVAFSPDGGTLASAGTDGTIRLWDTDRQKQIRRPLTGHKGFVLSVTFSPDGRTLASADDHGTIRLWDTDRHQHLGKLTGHTGLTSRVAFSPDGRILASTGSHGRIQLWDAHTHKSLGKPLIAHNNEVFSVAFSADRRTMASAGDDGTIQLWDTTTHKQIGKPLTDHEGPVLNMAFSPDGRTLASDGADHTIRLWPKILWRTDTELQNAVCRFAGNGLSTTEWARYAAGIRYRRSCP